MKAKILEINKITSDISEFILETKEKNLEVKAGQFVIVKIENGEEKIKQNAYSVVNFDKNSGKIILCIKNENGVGTTWLFSRNIGDELEISNGMGHFFVKNIKENLFFLATGIGLPPIIFQLKDLLEKEKTKEIKLFFGLRKEENVYYQDYLKDFSKKYKNFSYEIYLSREEKIGFKKGYVTDFFEKNELNYEKTEIYFCGSIGNMKKIKDFFVEKGIERSNFIFEAF